VGEISGGMGEKGSRVGGGGDDGVVVVVVAWRVVVVLLYDFVSFVIPNDDTVEVESSASAALIEQTLMMTIEF